MARGPIFGAHFNGQLGNIYRIAGFETLVELVPKLTAAPRKYNVQNLQQGVRQNGHLENAKVSYPSDTEVAVTSEREFEEYFDGSTEEGENFGETAKSPQPLDDAEPVREQIRAVNERLHQLLRKAGLSASRHNQIVAQMDHQADGCTLPEKIEVFEAEVQQLEFEFHQGLLV